MTNVSLTSSPNSWRPKPRSQVVACSSFTRSAAQLDATPSGARNLVFRIGCADGCKGMPPSKADKGEPSLSAARQAARRLLLIFFAVVTGLVTGRADENKTLDSNLAEPGATPPLQYQVKVVSSGRVEIGRPGLIGIYGSFAKNLMG